VSLHQPAGSEGHAGLHIRTRNLPSTTRPARGDVDLIAPTMCMSHLNVGAEPTIAHAALHSRSSGLPDADAGVPQQA
jgi:hypothetical protein